LPGAKFSTKLKLASVLVLLIGAAGAAGVLAQQVFRSDTSPEADQTQGPAASESRRDPGVDLARAPAPAYITQSRAMILIRLEEEVVVAFHDDAAEPVRPVVGTYARTWRLEGLSEILADVIDGFAVIENHPNVVVRFESDVVQGWWDAAAKPELLY
jgi:hypothetical protein